MAIQKLKVKATGVTPLLQNNPRTVDPFDTYSKAMAPFKKRGAAKTEESLLKLRQLEAEAKTYFDDEIGVYIPSRWIIKMLADSSYEISRIAKTKVYGAIFPVESKVKLCFKNMNRVKTLKDISKNQEFQHLMILPQRQVRLAKNFPIFHNWSFETEIEYDSNLFDFETIERILKFGGLYKGFGDFRPSFGRCQIEIEEV
jgi:hypothetical protein